MMSVRDFIRSVDGGVYDFFPEHFNNRWQWARCEKSGRKLWYIGAETTDGVIKFSFGECADKLKKFSWINRNGEMTDKERKDFAAYVKKVECEKTHAHLELAFHVQNTYADWTKSVDGSEYSAYLQAKGFAREVPQGTICRHDGFVKNILCVPMCDEHGFMWSVQELWVGEKRYWPGSRTKGLMFTFQGDMEDFIYVGEGFATCYAVWKETRRHTISAFATGNLEFVVKWLIGEKQIKPEKIVLLADWDGEGFKAHGKNTGMLHAQKLSQKYKVKFAQPDGWDKDLDRNWDFCDVFSASKPIVVRPQNWEALKDKVFDEKRVKPEKSENVAENDEKIEETVDNEPEIDENLSETIENPQILEETEKETLGPLGVKHCGKPWSKSTFSIETRETGFHRVVVDNKKHTTRYIPDYEGLRSFFEEENYFVTQDEAEIVWGFNGKCYSLMSDLSIKHFAEKHFDPRPLNKTASEFFGAVVRKRVVKQEFFSAERKINFQNGYLDLGSMEFRPHTPDIGFRHVLDYAFDENAICPEWDAFLDRVLSGDKEMIQLVHEYLGYVLSGDECWASKCLVLKGEGANGKSTFLKVVRALIGSQNIMSAKINEFKNEYSRQLLDGKLANIAEETPKDGLADSAIFKDLVSGGTMTVRAIYGSPYSCEMKAKLIFSCNDLPGSSDSSPALFRRLLIVPFLQTFDDDAADPFIAKKLKKELPGILLRALHGYFSLTQRGRFSESLTVKSAVSDFQKSSNPVAQWVERRVEVKKDSELGFKWVAVDSLYRNYRGFAEEFGYMPLNVENFSKTLRRVLKIDAQRFGRFRIKGKQARGILGLLVEGVESFDAQKEELGF